MALVAVVDTLDRLVGRAILECEADAAVGAIKEDGRFTGRVGDLTLGLTNPVLPEDEIDTGAGVAFFAADADVPALVAVLAVVVAGLEVVPLSTGFLTGSRVVLVAWVAPAARGRLVGVLGRAGDLAGAFVVVFVV